MRAAIWRSPSAARGQPRRSRRRARRFAKITMRAVGATGWTVSSIGPVHRYGGALEIGSKTSIRKTCFFYAQSLRSEISPKQWIPTERSPPWRSGNNHGFCVTGGPPPIASEPTPSPRLWATPPGATPAGLCEHTMGADCQPSKPELSTWPGIGTFYLAPTAHRFCYDGPRVTARRHPRLAGILMGTLAMACFLRIAGAQSGSSRICAGCHRDVWEAYRRTGMGRSFDRPSPENVPEDLTGKSTYYHQPSDSYFTMLRRDGKYYQQRYQIDSTGQQVNVMEKQIDYIMGSGNHSRAYLHRTAGDMLVELPLAWYAEKGGYWAMNPGYDRPDHDGFRRPITYDCMFCHNAYPQIPPGHEQPFARPVYTGALPEGIDCQRCHGPGDRHVQLAATAGSRREDIRNAIMNPSRLSAERQMEVCMVCHLETTSFPLPNAIQRSGRGPFSYRPAEPMSDFILNFDHAPGTGREDKFEIVNAAYRLRRSACFLKKNGKLLCTTCHNPHDAPRGEEAERHYSAVCRKCHASAFDKQVKAGTHTRAAGCVDCHMPKRRTEDVVHVVATDHYIQRQRPAGDLLADRPERQETGATAYRGPVVLYYPETLPHTPENDLDLAVAQVKQGSNLSQGIAQLSAAIEKYSPQRPEYYLELAEALQNN